MNLTNNQIILLAMIFATAIMIIVGKIQNMIRNAYYKKGIKRTKEVEQLVKNDLIPFTLINVDTEPARLEQPKDNIGIIIDKKLYTDKNSYILEKDGRVYIIGKKEDYMIALVGRYVGR